MKEAHVMLEAVGQFGPNLCEMGETKPIAEKKSPIIIWAGKADYEQWVARIEASNGYMCAECDRRTRQLNADDEAR